MQRAIRLIALGLGLTVGMLACETGDPSTPEYWIEKIKTSERKAAIKKLGEMKAGGAVAPLMDAYNEDRYRFEIVVALIEIGDKKAESVLVKAIEDTANPKAAELAASQLLKWEFKDHGDAYLRVVANTGASREVRYNVLKILAKWPPANAAGALLPILNGDPDLQPIAFNGLAGEALGRLQEKKAIPGLIKCLWMDDHLGRNSVPQCRMALNRIGPAAAAAPLIETLTRKNRGVEKLARKHHFGKGGLIEAKCAELLGDMPTPDAVEPLIAALKGQDDMPVSVQKDGKKAQAFVMAGVQKVISTANALAVIGDVRAVEPLLEVAGSGERPLEHKLSAVQQLAFLGRPEAIPGMLKLLDKEPHPRDPVSQGFRVQIALNTANIIGKSDKKFSAFKKKLTSIKTMIDGWITTSEGELKAKPKSRGIKAELKAQQEWARNYAEALSKVAAVEECDEDPICWGKKLTGKDIAIRMLAGYRLANSPAKDTALKQLEAHIGDPDMAVRNVVLFGLDRLGDHTLVPALKKALASDAEKAKKQKNLRGAVYTYELMIAKLTHKK